MIIEVFVCSQLQTSKEKLECRRLEQLSDTEDKQMLINENRKLAKDLDAVNSKVYIFLLTFVDKCSRSLLIKYAIQTLFKFIIL